jgi:hypothetical protein
MKNLLTVLGIGGLGWFLWEGMTAAIWWEIGKWVGTGLLSLIILYVLIWNIRNRAEQRAWETRRQGDKETSAIPPTNAVYTTATGLLTATTTSASRVS